jgi:hypothetical protein
MFASQHGGCPSTQGGTLKRIINVTRVEYSAHFFYAIKRLFLGVTLSYL